jgi:hypothetical protein
LREPSRSFGKASAKLVRTFEKLLRSVCEAAVMELSFNEIVIMALRIQRISGI